jgi:signal transduction histidine kinase
MLAIASDERARTTAPPPRVSFETARLALARLHFDVAAERGASLGRAARICSTALAVERVGIWLLEPGGRRLGCQNLFIRSEDRCRTGETIDLDAVPAYRAALATHKVIIAGDAQGAPATRELNDSYLHPLGITSMLNAPIFHEGEVVGLVGVEHIGPPRIWSDAECTFASSLADMLGMLIEQTDRRAAESALRDRIADEADHHRHELFGQIASGVAHDFGNIMQGITLALAELPDATAVERVRLQTSLLGLVTAATDLVGRLRSFSTAPRQGDRCDARAVLVALEAMLALLCRHTAELRLDVAAAPAWAAISRTDLERVVFNLVINARDALPGFGHISIRLHTAGDQWAIDVGDDGQGISQELLVQVFQPYFTTKAQGTGLGLATVRTIVEGAGGQVTVASKPGHGSCFTVVLRAIDPPAPDSGDPR